MFIKSATIKNFKCFADVETVLNFNVPDGKTIGSGLNIFVGENNSGKSTVFEAINFLRNGADGNLDILRNKKAKEGDDFFVELEFIGSISAITDYYSEKDFNQYIYNDKNFQILKARRSSNIYNVQQGKRSIEMTPKKIGIWNFIAKQFENPSGLDADFKKFFEIDFIWADTNPEDIMKFGASTICGKLLGEIVKTFKGTDEYAKFKDAHRKAFNGKESGLRKKLEEIKKRTNEIFQNQFNSAEIDFHFEEVEPDSFFKNTKIKVNDGKIETYIDENGSGMQRSVSLVLLQVYAENLVKIPEKGNLTKPFFLFIDEPEICLHPQAQIKLLNALLEISKKQQVFITTHSSYFLNPALIHNLYKFNKDTDGKISIHRSTDKMLSAQIKENRNFFFWHRDLFFTSGVIFLEGINDYEKYSKYCERNNFGYLAKYFCIMGTCDRTLFFEEFSHQFGLNFMAIVDRDFSFRRSVWSRGRSKEWVERIKKFINDNKINFNESAFTAAMANEFSESPEKGDKEAELIQANDTKILKVINKNILVLSAGEVDDYLDKDGNIINNNTLKEKELKAIFEFIKAKI